MTRPRVVHLASSSGGHLDLLVRLRSTLRDHHIVWVTQPSATARALEQACELIYILPAWSRSLRHIGRLATNVAQSLRYVIRDRPTLVITSGSGLVVPYCMFARLSGANIVFIETPARVDTPSQAGRVLSRIAARTLVQWPSMLAVYPRSQACYPPALEGVDPSRQGGGEGTYVGVGNHSQPFDRLLYLVDDAVARGLLPRPVVAQAGVSRYQPSTYKTCEWLDPHDVDAAIAASRYVVTHGGTGSISNALRHGRRPLVLARMRRFDEHVDDHQQQLVSEMASMELVVPLTSPISEFHLQAADIPLTLPPRDPNRPNLSDALRTTVSQIAGCR